jgi:putative flippase GtrA
MSSESITNKNTEPMGYLPNLLKRPSVRQLIKFCIVGASSAVIDNGLLFVLHFKMHLLSIVPAMTISFFCAVANGFYWNRRWTFGTTGTTSGDTKKQYSKFALSNSIGLFLNISITTGLLVLAENLGWLHTQRSFAQVLRAVASQDRSVPFTPLVFYAAKAVATLCVMAWNFTAARLWTFKK